MFINWMNFIIMWRRLNDIVSCFEDFIMNFFCSILMKLMKESKEEEETVD